MKDKYGYFLIAFLVLGLLFHFYMGLGGESETTGQRQAREQFEREQEAEIEERVGTAYEEGWDAGWELGYEDAREKYTAILREAAELTNRARSMMEEPEFFTNDDVYEKLEEACSVLSDYY